LPFISRTLDIVPFVDLDSFVEDVVKDYEIDLTVVGLVFEFVKTIDFDQESLGIALYVIDIVFENFPKFLILLS
jgi:hypothetical protein